MAELLGAFEQAVLVAVVRLGDDAYGRGILHQVQSSLKRNVSAGAVYATLDRLERRGLLRSRLKEGAAIRGGRPRRYYRVAAAGISALNDARAMLTEMWSHIKWPAKATR